MHPVRRSRAARRGRQHLLQRIRLDARADRRMPRRSADRRRLRRRPIWAHLARHRHTGRRPRHQAAAGPVHQPADQRPVAVRPRGVRDRPAAHRGQRHAGHAVQPDDRCQLRQPAARRDLLPDVHHHRNRRCVHLAGGRPEIPGTDKKFGGSSTKEFGGLLSNVYPGVGNQPRFLINDFRQVLPNNPCTLGGGSDRDMSSALAH